VKDKPWILVGDKVYCSGGAGTNSRNAYSVHSYDPSQDKWTTLPPLPVWYYSLGQINGKLVAVGGVKDKLFRRSDKVYLYDEKSQYWRKTAPGDYKPTEIAWQF
jgi:N-acetylneuraminic acid mutarotase